jgi:hypothetical protein
MNEIENRRLYLTARDRAQSHPLRQMVRKALRAMGTRRLSTEATRLFDDVLGPWESESIQKVVAHLTAKQEDLVFGVALEYNRIKTRVEALNRRAKSDLKRRENREEFELWVYNERLEHRESWKDFYEHLSNSRKFPQYLRPNHEMISMKAIQRIYARVVKRKNAR